MTDHADRATARTINRARQTRGWHAPANSEFPDEDMPDARTRALSRLIPLWPGEIAAADAASAQKVVTTLERALRAERRRGRAGHWSYDMNRHLALARALREERGRLAELRRTTARQTKPYRRGNSGRIETKAFTATTAS